MSAETVIAAAISDIGYMEKASNASLDSPSANPGYNNWTKFGRWYGLNPAEWCDMAVSYWADKGGESAAVGKFAYVPYHVSFFKNKGQYFARGAKTPMRGDVIFFGDADHIGYVEYVADGYVHTIEGNTRATGYSTNGGGVYRKSYALSSAYIMGYGRPNYSGTTTTTTTTTTATATDKIFDKPKTYKNTSGSTDVYAESALLTKVGSLNAYEECECLAIVNGKYLVKYKVDGSTAYKTGFVAYSGGVS